MASRRVESLPQLLLGLLALAVAVVLGALFVSSAVKAVKRSRDTITVTGSAKRPITADLVTWNLSVSSADSDPAAASKDLVAKADKVRTFLKDAGLDAKEPPVATEETSQKQGGLRVAVYRLTQEFNVTTKEIDKAEAAAGKVSTLFEQGIAVSANPLQYVSTQLGQARIEALKQATADAKRRAQTLVEGLGGHLGAARRADVGVFQITPRNSTPSTGRRKTESCAPERMRCRPHRWGSVRSAPRLRKTGRRVSAGFASRARPGYRGCTHYLRLIDVPPGRIDRARILPGCRRATLCTQDPARRAARCLWRRARSQYHSRLKAAGHEASGKVLPECCGGRVRLGVRTRPPVLSCRALPRRRRARTRAASRRSIQRCSSRRTRHWLPGRSLRA